MGLPHLFRCGTLRIDPSRRIGDNGEGAPVARSTMSLAHLGTKTLRIIGYWVIMAVVSVALFEGLLRLFGYRSSIEMYDYTLVFDDEILFRVAPDCAPDINSMGYRGADFEAEPRPGTRRLLFLGDSFVMGHNVPPGQTIAAGLAASLRAGYEVYNMGILAYGPDQSLVSFLDDGLALGPDMAILGLFAANDFQDLERGGLFSLDGGGRLQRNEVNAVSRHVPSLRAGYLFNRFQYLVQPKLDPHHKLLARSHEYLYHHLFADFYDLELVRDPESPGAQARIELMRAVLARFQSEARAAGVEFAVVILPSYFNIVDDREFLGAGLEEAAYRELQAIDGAFFRPEDSAVRLCEDLGIRYLNLYPEFLRFEGEERDDLFDPEDWHLSARGNRIAGELTARILVDPVLPTDDPWAPAAHRHAAEALGVARPDGQSDGTR